MENKRRMKAMGTYSGMYHQEVQLDSMQESMRKAFYSNVDPRRRQEMSDGGIVQEDDRAMANLPRQAIHHEYPKAGYYSSALLDDTNV